MESIELNVSSRSERGSVSNRRLRSDGRVPGIVYSEGKDALSFAVDEHDFKMNVLGCAPTQLFTLKSDEKDLDGLMTLVKDIQIEPTKDKVLHVDFLRVTEGHRIKVTVPIELVGESPAVKQRLAILNQTTFEVEIESLPSKIPASIKLDISELGEGQSLHVSNLELDEEIDLRTDPSLSVVSAVKEKAEAEPEEAEAAEGEVPAEGEAAPADAAAEGGEEKKEDS